MVELKTRLVGTSLGPVYHAPQVQAVLKRAIRVLEDPDAPSPAHTEAQDVLDLMYTAMMFGAFRDYKAVPSSGFTFEAVQ